MRRVGILIALLALTFAALAAQQPSKAVDPRVGLKPGITDAGVAASHIELLSHLPRPEGFDDPTGAGGLNFVNSDLAFQGSQVFLGNFTGLNFYDVEDPRKPNLRVSVICPGGQGDVSVYGSLLFVSVEERRGRVDCGTQGVQETVSADRFRGVRIFDISNFDKPVQIAAVQTCRGSHTHTLVVDPRNREKVYIYVSGTSGVRSADELEGCAAAADDPNTSLFSIDVIEVPVAAPQTARVVSHPRIFADPSTGAVNGLWAGGNHGSGTQTTSLTNQCHDITVYAAIGLAAGACAGNGILLDISDPVHPVRLDAVSDPNFAYWHSATFNNDGTKVIFSDEWGGGTQPRCRATDAPNWGADAIFTIANGKMTFGGYYKMPAAQSDKENCVAHNGSIVPVPGRDIMVQGWYQGGLSVFDFTDAAHPAEIAFFDRGPFSAEKLIISGFWAAYWYNGHIYGSEMGRGLDIFRLLPSEFLTQNELDAAGLAKLDALNVQAQQKMVWPASFVVARAYLDQLARSKAVSANRISAARSAIQRAEHSSGKAQTSALDDVAKVAAELERDAAKATPVDAGRMRAFATTVRGAAAAMHQ